MAGQMSVNVKLARRSKAGDPRGLQEMGAKGENVEERVDVGKQALSRTLSVKANGKVVTSV